MTRRQWLEVLAGIVFALLVLAAGAYWSVVSALGAAAGEPRCTGRERFDAAVWRDTLQVHGRAAPRGCMVDGLLARVRLRGRSGAEIVALLGEDSKSELFPEYDLVYWLGPERHPFAIDSEWLAFRLDSAGRVAEAKLVTD